MRTNLIEHLDNIALVDTIMAGNRDLAPDKNSGLWVLEVAPPLGRLVADVEADNYGNVSLRADHVVVCPGRQLIVALAERDLEDGRGPAGVEVFVLQVGALGCCRAVVVVIFFFVGRAGIDRLKANLG